ncbi:uncharacterized protein F5147DRAFT_776177 [Suillus discolor]|uniref:Uncharacterized protein n=1 Tax=Suillus discolor TaxID=1912936 RepID=A0A9P7F3F7_9AGAM|nr:uncharacterized protein F5147DRAFT_776177 [Suillus discolor]KAG2102822.1 hypothetical protein F5147DRAFT_776177 [Suillus discolor]
MEPEDIQTACEGDLFDQEETDSNMSSTENFMDAGLNQPSANPIQVNDAENFDHVQENSVVRPSDSVIRVNKREINDAQEEQVPSGKRRYQEVDYSKMLRKTVYEQEERVNKMKRKLCDNKVLYEQVQLEIQEQQCLAEEDPALTERDTRLSKVYKELEEHNNQIKQSSEALGLNNHKQTEVDIQTMLQDTHQRYAQQLEQWEAEVTLELARREAELNARKDKEFEEREKCMIDHMEQRLQLELRKFKAEKESKLANMERRFARRGRQQGDAEMNADPAPRSAQQQPKMPQKFLPRTPCLDSIKRIKKTRGTSHRTCLVSLVADDDPMEGRTEETPTIEREILQSQLDDAFPMSIMESSVSKCVEAALRRIFIDREFPLAMKRSPRRKKLEDQELQTEQAAELNHERDFLLAEVRRVFKDHFEISQDSDFIVHQPAIREDVYSYEHEDGLGPDPKKLAFDLANRSKTLWNAKVLDLLLRELQERCVQEGWPFQRSDRYYKAIIEERYKQLRTVWKAVQPKVTERGVLETAVEVEDRLNTKKDETLKTVRQSTRRRNKYIRRTTVLKHLIDLKNDQKDEDLQVLR